MNSKRSYLDAVNTGRQRRSYASLEQLNRSLDTLEQRIERNREETANHGRQSQRSAAAPGQGFETQTANPHGPEPRSAYEQPYRSIARDIERVRKEEDGVAAFGKIAGELKGLREELRHQMASSLRREFDTLRNDFQHSHATGGEAVGKLGLDLERLSGAIHSIGDRADDKTINMLRLEIEQMKSALDSLAREETVRSVDRRWDAFDQRFNDFEHRLSAGTEERANSAELAALTDRIEQISQAVGNLPQSPSFSSLEEKVRTLAGALDHFIEQQGGRATQTFAHIEERLDEISRAIVSATVAVQQQHVDPEPFERIEARISALARQIEEVAEDRAGEEVMEHLQSLSRRVDDLATRAAVPDDAIERLAYQISVIADKVDHAPKVPDVGDIFSGIEQRFDVLSSLFERRQDDALEQGNVLFRELERRLNDVAERFEQRQAEAALDTTSIMKAIDQRFSAFAETLDSGRRDGLGEEAIRGLETRLEGISRRLDQSASHFAGVDPDLVKSLEAQVAGLTAHLAKPSAPLPEFVDISPRLKEIERTIADSRESVLEAARTIAENAARSLAISQPVVASGFADELKALEDLTRRSDERNSKTFEAIHDTLLKIVDRMTSLEQDAHGPARKLELRDAPSIDADGIFADADEPVEVAPPAVVERTPAQAAAAAAIAALGSERPAEEEQGTSRVRSMLGGLSRAFSKKNAPPEPPLAGSVPSEPTMNMAPTEDLDTPLDPKLANRPLEPGSGAPDLNAIMRRVRDERSQPVRTSETDAGKSDFIAAARRAAQAAAAEANVNKRKSDVGTPVKALRLGDMLKSRRKSLLLAATAIMTTLALLQLGKPFVNDAMQVAGLGETAPAPADVDATPLGSTASAAQAMAAAAAPVPADDRQATYASLPMDAAGKRVESAQTDVMSTEATHIGGIPSEDLAMDGIPMDAMAMDGVQVAAIAPVEHIIDAASASVPAVPIAIPAEAGPLPLREAAAAGDGKALFEVATRYAEGRGVKADMAEAAKWYERSAEAGFAPAEYRIGNMYEKGTGVTRDVARSRDWYEKAAEKGNASAMHNLAVLYAMGADGQTDNDAAAMWFIKAAELGVKDSQFNLGILSAKGVGMKQSLEEAYKWFALVAKTGDKDAANKRDEIANALRPEQLERARAATELWKPRALDPQANTVDIPDAWQEDATKTAGIDMKKAVQNIQAILNKKGYEVGNPDGVMGGRTKAAIAQFQKDNGMAPTGEIDETLVKALVARK
ncbi:MAG TPA: peptidoglycan-binding protein [Rhizobiaceae bacterium]